MLHTWTYCAECDSATVKCGVCGNKTCNGKIGKLINGLTCKACDSAYSKFEAEFKVNGPKHKRPDRIRVWRQPKKC